jgi:hypothetical protein
MAGVAPPRPGIGMRQATFSFRLNLTGTFSSAEIPFPDGPRHWDQFSA